MNAVTSDNLAKTTTAASARVRARRGLTLPELILATAMLAIIASAASVFALAVTAGWRNGDDAFRLANLSSRSGNRVEDAVLRSRYVLQAKPAATAGEASYLFCWAYDGLTGVADGKAQLGEMMLIEFDPATRAIWLREPIAAEAMTAAQLDLASSSAWGDPTSPDVIAYFRTLDFVAARKTVIGGQSGASEVTGASFGWFAPSGAKPMVTYSTVLRQNGLTTTSQGSIVLRTALQPVNLN